MACLVMHFNADRRSVLWLVHINPSRPGAIEVNPLAVGGEFLRHSCPKLFRLSSREVSNLNKKNIYIYI